MDPAVSQNEVADATAVDAKVQNILRSSRALGATVPDVTEQSIREGEAYMEKTRRDAVITLLERVARKELISEDELRKKLGVNRKWIPEAVTANRLFYMQTPAGGTFYPAFFGNPAYNRHSLEIICEKLGNLPGPSKLHFFTSKSTYLGIRTPLEALSEGMFTEVLITAEGFAER